MRRKGRGGHSCFWSWVLLPFLESVSLATSLSAPCSLWSWGLLKDKASLLQKALPRTLQPDLMVKPGLSPSSLDSTALDAIREALQLLESVKPEAQDKDRLLDDKAQALLWLYICTLEAKMQEVSAVALD